MRSRIASGGMGDVWLAEDSVLGRLVAVKVLKREYAGDVTFRARFETEARHAASLSHPNIAAVFDFGENESDDGGPPRPYLVMEFVEGSPLSELIEPGRPMAPERVRDLVGQAADALALAHQSGIVHRDVKPANLMVTPTGQVKVTDFGIARAADGVALTVTGEVIGTPHYLSPEQAEGRTATPASDVYALGVVLFECLTGTRPFAGNTPITTALAHLREPIPDLPGDIPADLVEVTRRALTKDPAERYHDAGALAAALGATVPPLAHPAADLTQAMPPPTEPLTATSLAGKEVASPTGGSWAGSEPRRRLPVWPIGAVGALAVVVVLAVMLNHRGPAPAPAGGDTNGATASAAARASPAASSTRVVASRFVGLTIEAAKAKLSLLGFNNVRTTSRSNPGGKQAGTVAALSPTGKLQEGATITLDVWSDVTPRTTTPKPSSGHGEKHGKGKQK